MYHYNSKAKTFPACKAELSFRPTAKVLDPCSTALTQRAKTGCWHWPPMTAFTFVFPLNLWDESIISSTEGKAAPAPTHACTIHQVSADPPSVFLLTASNDYPPQHPTLHLSSSGISWAVNQYGSPPPGQEIFVRTNWLESPTSSSPAIGHCQINWCTLPSTQPDSTTHRGKLFLFGFI